MCVPETVLHKNTIFHDNKQEKAWNNLKSNKTVDRYQCIYILLSHWRSKCMIRLLGMFYNISSV